MTLNFKSQKKKMELGSVPSSIFFHFYSETHLYNLHCYWLILNFWRFIDSILSDILKHVGFIL